MQDEVQKILVKFPLSTIMKLERIGKKHKLIHRYGGEERVALARVVEFLCNDHPEMKGEKKGV